MNIKHYMTQNVVTINPDTRVTEAVDLMEEHDFHSLPVVKSHSFVGLVTEDLIKNKTSSAATSLSIYELNYLLDKTTVKEIMEKNVQTTSQDLQIEEAAILMVDKNITVLPVIDEGKNVNGIITYKDIFRALIELSGYQSGGDRLIIEVEEDSIGVLDDITSVLAHEDISISHIFVNRIEEHIEITIQISEKVGNKAKVALIEKGYRTGVIN
ncbi:CBS and ACT domain-containing protein [Tetragenococcus koreensis]|uniref:Acetoin utilization protein n=2 Tax=Tetragenococcus muriaticus TaxID=64642 RepID=A0A091BXS6_9ENTE|nr:CBS and ACT domain-containing protein [Tetragenococcus koreensis]KFN89270.1 acetoin utilization protein [Tetragenococcus muriaticus PMC-11-5]MDN6507435.1 CBS and ACT domain-containing protein [Tetragenococcus halophilus]MCF1618074.1 CBS and ACT domain-containing protein [Tetragenococcus koreensis]MCF1622130.1 CBS and ACT domain-containing protein [Tetragenococcus koreensis]MCF1627402.1 CBS and ACT domain-containing protein [Tetragenococcus koreensis]